MRIKIPLNKSIMKLKLKNFNNSLILNGKILMTEFYNCSIDTILMRPILVNPINLMVSETMFFSLISISPIFVIAITN